MKRLCCKLYYRITFQLISSMNIGSGLNETTDNDLLRNSEGKPYIPGSTLAGIYRSLFSKEEAAEYFGDEISIEEGNKKKLSESSVLVYDANIISETFKIISRDCVALDEYKTGISGAKFDFEILEPGVSFVAYIEQNIKDKAVDIGKKIIERWLQGDVVIGAKSTRGLGKTKVLSVGFKEFDLKENLDSWLDFDMYDSKDWEKIDLEKLRNDQEFFRDKINIRLFLKQAGGISIRKYTTAVNEKGKEQPDYEQMIYVREEEGKNNVYPVIPGTSWAGAFRHQIEKIDRDCIGSVFGICKNNGQWEENRKSEISFSESEITGATVKQITRNALDRFTNATIDGALYTERTYFGGNTILDIDIKKEVSDRFKKTLAAAILDLHLGFLAVGGLTSSGRGLFCIEKIQIGDRLIEKVPDDGEGVYDKLCELVTGG